MDAFTKARLARYLGQFKQDHGRDARESELLDAGFSASNIDAAVRAGLLDKYQVTVGSGARENRFKLHRDWKSLNL